MKDFVAKVGKSYEKGSENTEEAESMSVKVSLYRTLLLYGYCGSILLLHSQSSIVYAGSRHRAMIPATVSRNTMANNL